MGVARVWWLARASNPRGRQLILSSVGSIPTHSRHIRRRTPRARLDFPGLRKADEAGFVDQADSPREPGRSPPFPPSRRWLTAARGAAIIPPLSGAGQ